MNFEKTIKKYLTENRIVGGKADGLSVVDLAKKHNVGVNEIKKQLSMGIKIEMEHTTDRKSAKEIAMDHIFESPVYYSKLKKMEQSFDEMVSMDVVGGSDAIGGVAPQDDIDYAPNDSRNIFGGEPPKKKRKCKKKETCKKMGKRKAKEKNMLMLRRNLGEV